MTIGNEKKNEWLLCSHVLTSSHTVGQLMLQLLLVEKVWMCCSTANVRQILSKTALDQASDICCFSLHYLL